MYWYSNHEKKFLRSFLHLWMSTYVPTTSLCCRRGHHLASMPTTSRLSPTMLLCQCDKRRIIVPVVIMPKTAWTLSCRQLGMRTDIRMWNNIRIIKCSYGYPVVGIMKLAKCGLVNSQLTVNDRSADKQSDVNLVLSSAASAPPPIPNIRWTGEVGGRAFQFAIRIYSIRFVMQSIPVDSFCKKIGFWFTSCHAVFSCLFIVLFSVAIYGLSTLALNK